MARGIGFGIESTWNTGVTPNKFFEARSENLHIEKAPIRVETLRSPSVRKIETDQERVVGDIEAICNFQEIGFWLYMLLGNVDVTGAGPYTHTLPGTSGVDGDTNSFTGEVNRQVSAFTYPGLMVTALTIDVQRGQELRARVSVQGPSDQVSTGAATSPTYLALDTALPKQVAIKLDGTTHEVENFTLSCAWPVDDPYVLGNVTYGLQPQRNGVLDVSFTLRSYFSDLADIYNDFVGNTDVDVQLDVQTSGDEALTINLNKCRFLSDEIPTDGRARFMEVSGGASYYDTDPTENIQAVVINDQATTDFS